jgi:hypothetical protein
MRCYYARSMGKSVTTFQAAFLQTRSFMTGLLIGLALVVPFLR